MSDAEAEDSLAAIASGDVDALERLYRALRVPVYATALSIVAERGAAEDVLQDTFVRVFEHASRYEPRARPRAWVLAITRNLALDFVRRRSRDAARRDTPPRADSEDPVSRLHVTAALLQLEPAEREIVALHDLGGLTHAEIADAVGLPAGTVRWKYRIALGRLESILVGADD